jgi:drug/metabolite transporter (DMT)-like permease
VKGYLIITGLVFGLMAVLHVLRAIDEFSRLTTDPGYYLGMSGLGIVAAGLSAWAWCLLRLLRRRDR